MKRSWQFQVAARSAVEQGGEGSDELSRAARKVTGAGEAILYFQKRKKKEKSPSFVLFHIFILRAGEGFSVRRLILIFDLWFSLSNGAETI